MFLVKLYDKFQRNPIHLTSNRSINRQIEDRLKQSQKSPLQFRFKMLNKFQLPVLLNMRKPLIIKEVTKKCSIILNI